MVRAQTHEVASPPVTAAIAQGVLQSATSLDCTVDGLMSRICANQRHQQCITIYSSKPSLSIHGSFVISCTIVAGSLTSQFGVRVHLRRSTSPPAGPLMRMACGWARPMLLLQAHMMGSPMSSSSPSSTPPTTTRRTRCSTMCVPLVP